MTVSHNGWPASRQLKLAKVKVGPAIVSVLAGDVATIFEYLMQEFHKNVEPLKKPSCGGFNYRVIRGGGALSNHASGTAIDLNWGGHPLGAKGTFSATQVKEIRKILKTLDGVVRWGGDYNSRKDEMHFEIVGTPGEVSRVAKKLVAPQAPIVVKPTVKLSVPKPPVKAPVSKPKLAPKPKPEPKYVLVKKGDSLSRIAEKHGISLAKLLSLNPKKKKNPDAIDIGERIRVS